MWTEDNGTIWLANNCKSVTIDLRVSHQQIATATLCVHMHHARQNRRQWTTSPCQTHFHRSGKPTPFDAASDPFLSNTVTDEAHNKTQWTREREWVIFSWKNLWKNCLITEIFIILRALEWEATCFLTEFLKDKIAPWRTTFLPFTCFQLKPPGWLRIGRHECNLWHLRSKNVYAK